MNINPLNTIKSSFSQNYNSKKNDISFKSIYIDQSAFIGEVSEKSKPPKFLLRDAMILNKIASLYPNQDCFIKAGFGSMPELQYRERPLDVQLFSKMTDSSSNYRVDIDVSDEKYPVISLITKGMNRLGALLGMPTRDSLDVSLAHTVKAGYDMHKRILKERQRILEYLPELFDEDVDIGEKNLLERSHDNVKTFEMAITRLLLELRYKYSSEHAKSKTPPPPPEKLTSALENLLNERIHNFNNDLTNQIDNFDLYNPKDICDIASFIFPDDRDNPARIEQLLSEFDKRGVDLLKEPY